LRHKPGIALSELPEKWGVVVLASELLWSLQNKAVAVVKQSSATEVKPE
jgi:hypothetical protein